MLVLCTRVCVCVCVCEEGRLCVESPLGYSRVLGEYGEMVDQSRIVETEQTAASTLVLWNYLKHDTTKESAKPL